jgi:hypothetical protein
MSFQTGMQTEFEFQLPRGLIDEGGQVHREGAMRLAVALDEIETMHDPRVQENEAYLPVLLLSRVIPRLGSLAEITPQTMERMFASDLAYLEDLYIRLNGQESVTMTAVCPHCSSQFIVQVAPLA